MAKSTGIAWITGASSGIGQALAMQLAAQGWQVAISARNTAALHDLQQKNAQLHAYPLDVTDLSAIRQTVQAIEQQLGAIELAVLNAGDYTPMSLAEFDSALFAKLMQVNYLGVVHGLDALRDPMLSRRHGQILITASVAGYRGLPRAAPYGATKAALINLAESLHNEFAAHGVRLRVINPGFVQSKLTAKNDFAMPALLTAEQAAGYIVRALDKSGFEISFPPAFVFAMKRLRNLPYALYFPLLRWMMRQ